jgi:hypothetical protein
MLALLATLTAQPGSTALAVSSAFTYQGRLNDGGASANGTYDLRFTVYDANVAGVVIAGPLTNSPTVISNGLFTVLLDFGGNVFTGPDRWLEIGTRTNGGGAFTTLTPRQQLTVTPYALTSSNLLGTVAAGQITGTLGTSQIANDAVTSAKVLDGSLQGTDLAPNTVTSVQLADSIDLGSTSATGLLNVYRTSANTPAITLTGSASQISTFGSDGLEQIRLWGTSYGEILLHDSSTNNYTSVLLTANGTSGGYLNLAQGNSAFSGFRAYGDNLGGGRVLGYNSSNTVSLDLRAQYDSLTAAAWAGFYDNGSERISFAARNGTSGKGGLIDVKNNSSQNTMRLIGDDGTGRGNLEMYQGSTLVGTLASHSGGSWLQTWDELGNLTAIIGSSSGVGGFCELHNAAGAVGLRLDGDDAGGGLVVIRNAAGVATITLDGDLSGDGRVITQELQITGGSDLSEQFDINPTDGELEPGMIVCIDPRHPGELIPSGKAYDSTVAGVISGAGGVKPGMLMGQQGTKANGKHPVALTGRVYALADASHGAIKPGDMLTTSDTAGHAMRVTDHAHAQGAIIGKAMTSLDEGKGLVLVLVTLQ